MRVYLEPNKSLYIERRGTFKKSEIMPWLKKARRFQNLMMNAIKKAAHR